MVTSSRSSRSISQVTYLTRDDLESLVHWLASELFKDYESPMPAFTLMGQEGSDLLDSALALPRQSAFGRDAYPTVPGKAAVLFRSLVRNHCLVDGNKRLATAATLVFLIVNGWLLFADPDELIDQALLMASPRGMSWRTMSGWLKQRAYDMMAPGVGRTFFTHLEAGLRQAHAERTLSDADLRQALEFLNTLAPSSSGAGMVGPLLALWKGIFEGRMPETVVSIFRRALEAAVKELRTT